ncbi:MAG TPA: porin [Thiothrix sp.]|nr:porin [Thiothrix sp.]
MNHRTTSVKSAHALSLGIASSLLMLTPHYVQAANEINIIPSQRQVALQELGIFTLRFEVENRSGISQTLIERLTLPPQWKTLTDNGAFLLANGQRDVRLVHVVAPRGAQAGDYAIHYDVSAVDDGGINSRQTIQVNVAEQSGVTITPTESPNSLLSGEAYNIRFLVENTGNKSANFSFLGKDDDGFIQSVSPKQQRLAAGESTVVRIKGKITGRIKNTETYTVRLKVRGAGGRHEESVNIPLIARIPEGLSRYQTLKGELKSRYVHTQKEGAEKSESQHFQVEYRAKGALDKAGKHHIDVHLKTATERGTNTNSFKQPSSYRLTYSNPEWEIKAGHQNFYATNLIGNALNGVGLSARYQPAKGRQPQSASSIIQRANSPLKIQAFYGQSRSTDLNQEKLAAALLEYQWEDYSVGVNLLKQQKQEDVSQLSTDALIASVMGKWKKDGMTAQLEVATDDQQNAAYSMDVSAQFGKLGVNGSYLNAQPGFSGGYADTTRAYANASYQLDDRTRLTAGFRYHRDNVDNDPAREQRRDRETNVGISRTFGEEQQIEVSLKHSSRQEQDLRDNPTTDRTIHATGIQYRQRFDKFDILAGLEFGQRNDEIAASSSGFKKALSFNWRPEDYITLGANLSESDNLDRAGKQRQMGLLASYQPDKRSRLSGSMQRIEDTFQDSFSNNFDARYEYTFKNGNRFGVQARRTESQASDGEQINDHGVFLEFSMPLDVPIRRRDDIGSLRGQVNFADTQQPAKDVVIQMDGQYAVTNDQGEFHYPNIAARDYQIQVDNTRHHGKGYLLKNHENDANTVNVTANQTSKVQLELTPGAKITGRLVNFVHNTGGSSQSLIEDKGISMALLELHPIGEPLNRITHKRTTLFDGSFSFFGVAPGQWKLVVTSSKRLPSNSRLEQKELLLNLEQGDNKALTIRAIPTSQTIQKIGPSGGFDLSG